MTLGRAMRGALALLTAAAFLLMDGARLQAHHDKGVRESSRREVHLPIPDFSLTDQTGAPFRFVNLRGRLVLLSFVYTTCPDLCPLITTSLRRVQEGLENGERRSVHLLSITTDPEIDRPDVLKSYGERYGVDFSNWSFLTGGPGDLAPVWKAFGVRVRRKARGLVDHTTLTTLVDREGVMRYAYHGTSPDPKVILQDLRALLSLKQ